MHLETSDLMMLLQLLVTVGGLVSIYTGLKVKIEVIATKVTYIERQLKMTASGVGDL